jgi:tetratricopeptide (TPR) repeat protein
MAQEQHEHDAQQTAQPRKRPGWTRWAIAGIALLLIAGGTLFWLEHPQSSLIAILPIIIFTVLGVVISLFQWLFPVGSNAPAHPSTAMQPAFAAPGAPAPQIIVHVPPQVYAPAEGTPRSGPLGKPSYRGILGFPPPTDPRTIQQRENAVRELFASLCEPHISAIVLTGIGGVGKSTLAALTYRYAEEQRESGNGPFAASAVWLSVDSAVTMADLAGNLFDIFGKPLPDFSALSLQHQAMALFNVLNSADQPRLVILDQFENLLDIQTGHALADRPGVGEWLDAINSQPCASKILLTSRLWPLGTREYPPTYMQEHLVPGLELNEGIELLRKLRVEGSDEELRAVVEHCQGHAFSLTLLASLLRSRHLTLSTIFEDPIYKQVWTGNMARNLLDVIYTQQLNDEQRHLLLAFSVYRKPVPLEAAEAHLAAGSAEQRLHTHAALDALLNQHLLQAMGQGRYQLHAIVASYAQGHFVEGDESANREAVNRAHARAAEYYVQYGTAHCPPRQERRKISEVEPFIEASWQFCEAERWPDALELIERESLFVTLKRAGGNAILLEMYQDLSPQKWQPTADQQAHIMNNLGAIHRSLGRMEQARRYLEQALEMFQECGNRTGEAWALNDLGRVFVDIGNRERARLDYERSLHIFQEQGDQRGAGSALNNLGWASVMQGEDEQARDYYGQALQLFRDVGDRLGEGSTLNSLGRAHEDIGQWEKAQEYYEQGLRLFQEERDRKGISWSLNNLGKVYRKLGDYEQALSALNQALEIRREIDRKGEGRTLKNLGAVYEMLGDKAQALVFYRQSIAIAREVKDREGEGKTLRNLGKLYLDEQRYEASLAALLLAKNILSEVYSTYFDESERGIETVRKTLGDDAYAALLTKVEPHAGEIVEEELKRS